MPATSLSRALYTVFEDITGSSEEARKQVRAAQVENAYKTAVESSFGKAANLVLKHTNAVYCFEEKGIVRFVVYADDGSIRSSLDARQGLLKVALLKQGIQFDQFKALPAQKSIKARHPFEHSAPQPQMQPAPPARELTSDEMRKVEAFAAPIDDAAVRESFKQAVISVLRAEEGKS